MTNKLELKSSHEAVYTVNVEDVESIFYCKPTDPDILTVLMKDGKRLYCDEVCPVQEEPVNEVWHDASEEPNDMSHCLIFYGSKESVGHYLHYEPVLYNKREKMFVTSSFPHPTGYKVEQKSFDGGCVAEVYKDRRDRISISDITQWCYFCDLHKLSNVERTVKDWKEMPVSEELEEAAKRYATEGDEISGLYIIDEEADAFKAGAKWGMNQAMAEIQMQSMALAHGCPKEKTSEDLKNAADNALESISDQYDIISVGSCLEMFRLGAKWQEEKDNEEKVLTYKHGFDDCKEHIKEYIKEVLLSEVLPCFMHGGEADEVVAKLDEVLNQKK